MKIKKIKAVLFTAITAVFVGAFSLVGCEIKDETEILLQNFEDTEASALLGEYYNLPASVKDSDGNEYTVTYSVKTKTGYEASVFNNAFLVNELENYVVTCYANVSKDDIRSREIIVKVEDKEKPEINFEDVANGIVGVKYYMPRVSVSDKSKEKLTPSFKLYALNGDEKGEEFEIIENAFTPTASGNYLVEATAVDGSGNTATESKIIYIHDEIKINEILSFDNEIDVARVSASNAEISYLEEYEGEEGIVKFSYTGGYWANAFTFLPLRDVSNYSDVYNFYDSLVVRMYVVQSDEAQNYFTNVAVKNYKTNTNYYSSTPIAYNQWVDYEFDIAALEAFAGNDFASNGKIWGYGNEELSNSTLEYAGEFYVADIFMLKNISVTIEGELELSSDITIVTDATLSDAVYTLKKPSGDIVNLTSPFYKIDEYGEYTLSVSGLGYFGETTFKVIDERELLYFDSKGDLSYATTDSSRGEWTWMESYEGEKGVARLDWVNNKWPSVSMVFSKTVEERSKYQYVVFRIYIPQSKEVSGITVNNGKVDGATVQYKPVDTTIVTGQWFDCKFDVNAFSNWTDGLTAKELWSANCKFFLTLKAIDASETVSIYISEIRLEGKIETELATITEANGENSTASVLVAGAEALDEKRVMNYDVIDNEEKVKYYSLSEFISRKFIGKGEDK